MIKAGSVSAQVNLTMDIYPTLLEIAGVPIKHKIEGRSFLNTLISEKNTTTSVDENRVLYFTRREGGMEYGGKAYHAIRQGDWKLLQNNPYRPLELYNLKLDPQEKNNLIKQEPKIAEKLNALLLKQIQESGKVPWQK
jgi:arylsulfatase A-like enzyme